MVLVVLLQIGAKDLTVFCLLSSMCHLIFDVFWLLSACFCQRCLFLSKVSSLLYDLYFLFNLIVRFYLRQLFAKPQLPFCHRMSQFISGLHRQSYFVIFLRYFFSLNILLNCVSLQCSRIRILFVSPLSAVSSLLKWPQNLI